MGKLSKRLLKVLAGLLVIGLPAYYLLVLHSPKTGTPFPLDIAKIRAEANAIPGAKPLEVRYEHVMSLTFSQAMIIAGGPWRKSPMPVYSYQLVYPDGTLIIDTALDRSLAQPGFLVGMFDDAAFRRMQAAMERASQIVITHEHMDHIGGIAVHPHLERLLPALRLTEEQLAHPEKMKPAVLPAAVMQGYQPLRYDGTRAIAPGVVLVKSPGHTPGSQMVYVQLADGRELLFLGDVSWRLGNIRSVRERPLFMTLIIGEDRSQVIGEFQALHALEQSEPGIHLVPGHDARAIAALSDGGFLVPVFR
jgi:glyoxylase-like metal-dependent hydrolase (beta-lactamase superfamily II)